MENVACSYMKNPAEMETTGKLRRSMGFALPYD